MVSVGLLGIYICIFTTREHKIKRWFCTQKKVLNFDLKLFGVQK